MAEEPDEMTLDESSKAAATGGTSDAAPTAAEIRSQIEETRAEMSDTIDAIQERLSPSRVVSDARQRVEDATVGRVRRLARQSRKAIGDRCGSFSARDVLRTPQDKRIAIAVTALAAGSLLIVLTYLRRQRMRAR